MRIPKFLAVVHASGRTASIPGQESVRVVKSSTTRIALNRNAKAVLHHVPTGPRGHVLLALPDGTRQWWLTESHWRKTSAN